MKTLFLIFFGLIILIQNVYGDLFIIEVLPNTTNDKELEYVRIFNSGDTEIDLGGYKIIDKADKEYIFPSGEILDKNIGKKFFRGQTGIALNNTNEKLYLYNNLGKLIDVFSYKTSIKGKYILKSDLDTDDDTNKIPYSSVKRRIDEIMYNNSINKDYYSNLDDDELIIVNQEEGKKNIAFRGEDESDYKKDFKNINNSNTSDNSGDVIMLTNDDKIIFTILLVTIGFMMLFIILRKNKII